MIRLTVNGKPKKLKSSVDLVSFLKGYKVNLLHVAVGYNGVVVDKEKYSSISLQEGDVLEIVRPVGGG